MSSAGPVRPRRRRQAVAWGRYLPPVVLIVALLVLWELASKVLEIQPWLLPAPMQILRAAADAQNLLGQHIRQTAAETILGFGLALAIGLGLGMLIDASPLLRDALYPLLVISQTVPTIAIAPLLVIWLGYGILPKIIVVGLICFFPIVVNTADGLRSVDPDLIALLRTMGASPRDIFLKVRLPGAMPAIFTGVKIGVTYSVVGAILGEWVGGSAGLGIFMLRASNSFRTDWVFVAIAVTALLSIILFGLVAAVERLALPWYYTAAREERWQEL